MAEKQSQQINDLIFRELIKRGYSLEGNTRIWNIADSKLWYLTPEQAQAYLNLEDEEEYKKTVTQQELDLIDDNAKEILEKFGGEPINIIDIGCGDGGKASMLIEKLKGTKIRYCPIDISSYMVNKAIEKVSKTNTVEVIEFQWNISDFENINNISTLLRQGEYKKNVFLLLGNTLGNFEINELLYEIRSSMKGGDYLLIGNGLDHRKPEEILNSYNTEHFNKFSIYPLLQLGLKKEDVEFGVRFKNSRIESFYTIKNPKEISFLGRSLKFEAGDQVIVIVSYKYKKSDFISFMNLYFDESTVKVSENGAYSLAICKK
ncbi:L-histidine N(alpha)-methyltransferase [archaeon]|nr:L-histidine N(alpha)-methyltransferase [archaeon]